MDFRLEIADKRCTIFVNEEKQNDIYNLDIHCEPNNFNIEYDKYVRENGKLKVVDDEIVTEHKTIKIGE